MKEGYCDEYKECKLFHPKMCRTQKRDGNCFRGISCYYAHIINMKDKNQEKGFKHHQRKNIQGERYVYEKYGRNINTQNSYQREFNNRVNTQAERGHQQYQPRSSQGGENGNKKFERYNQTEVQDFYGEHRRDFHRNPPRNPQEDKIMIMEWTAQMLANKYYQTDR